MRDLARPPQSDPPTRLRWLSPLLILIRSASAVLACASVFVRRSASPNADRLEPHLHFGAQNEPKPAAQYTAMKQLQAVTVVDPAPFEDAHVSALRISDDVVGSSTTQHRPYARAGRPV